MKPALVVLSALAAMAAVAAPPPSLTLDPERGLVLESPAAVLTEEAVSRHLESGLTTSFVFRAEVGGRALGAARVDIRYDLWDEVFDVVAVGTDGRGERARLAGRAALQTWWSHLTLLVAEPGSLSSPPPHVLVLAVEVAPFSASEQDDAQRWFVRSFGATAASGGPRVEDSAEPGGDSLEKVLGVLMATSIRSSALFSARWAVTVAGTR